MTVRANGRQAFGLRSLNGVIAVTRRTLGPTRAGKAVAVWTGHEKTSLGRVALATHFVQVPDLRGRRTVHTVTVDTRRSATIPKIE